MPMDDPDIDIDDEFVAAWLAIHGAQMEAYVAEIIAAEDTTPEGWIVANDRW